MKEIKHFISGELVGSASGKLFDNVSPANGQVIGRVHEAGRAEVDAAVRAARAALKGPWGKMTVAERAEILHRVADGITARFGEFLEARMPGHRQAEVAGQPHRHSARRANFKVFADLLKNVANEAFEMATPDGAGALNYGVRRPKGVIGVISPWNLPLLLMTWKVGPALACGNCVVVKPSEETPLTATLLGEVMQAAGVPAGVYNVVHGFGGDSAGAFLTEHPDVDAYTFTGETGTGETIMRAAAKGVRQVSLELGGKNAGIVFADCDMDKAIEGTLRSAFANCGQVCLGTERVYVERPIFDAFVARLKAGAEALKIGEPNDPEANFGPLISHKPREKVPSYYQQAVDDGATVVTGGGVPEMPAHLAGGAWVQPTIWTGLADDSAVVTEEIFGPCCHIRPFDSEEEAIELANSLPYGLASAIWTENVRRAHRVAGQIEAGIVWVNSWFLRDLRTAFGGSKQSGIGREGGVHSLEFYTELKNICVKL
uniref:2-hydroxymuconic semialdehyde dehydrogenase n=3 Tax=Pseudomonadaceae TaxID=135621 RepID=XYLG_PSEPU|nr:2-hydroxymuconic semialdehyde dehydrogenase [Pseudomonas putida]P23105.1 RecName: Full=2-hydroxymuconic semialdehyde dehydrogenase; Short=HMSD [Pseudomonas putida]AAA26053.1 2-hydroxymuconic semialdehyde dehydrogenase [Plasmid pWW0]CAC86805.1 xylG [Pseudomonas putida]